MNNKKYYRGVKYTKRNGSGIAAVVLGIIVICLIALIVWAVATFSGGNEDAFKDQSSQISELKIENEMLKKENEELKQEIEKYKNGEYDDKDDEQITAVTPSPQNSPNSQSGAKNTNTPKNTPPASKKPTPTPSGTPVNSTNAPYEEQGQSGQQPVKENNSETETNRANNMYE